MQENHILTYLVGMDVTAEALSFDGRPLYSVAVHGSPEGNVTTERDYAYTAEGLLRELKMRVDGGEWVSLASNRYDDLRRLQDTRMIDSQVFVGYGYTPEGKLRSVDSEAFSQTLYREKRPNGATGYLAGDISALEFRLASTDLEVETRQGEGLHGLYDYIYDGGMLKSAAYTELSRTSPMPSASNVGVPVHRQPDYSVAYSYDGRGNATSIKRRGVTQTSMEQVKGADGVSRFTEFFDYGLVDDLTLNYEGNRLTKVYDAAEDPDFAGANDFVDGVDEDTEYEYDVLGRLTKDKNKGITSIAYNEIGLPSDVFIAGAHIRYTYAAGGELLCKAYGTDVLKFLTGSPWSPGIPYVVFESDSRRDYIGSAEYLNGTLERLNHEAGWWNADGRHTAAIRDWQGSLRATWTEGDYTQTLAPPSTLFPGLTRRPRLYKNLTAYYPYGLPFADRQGTDRYLYSGKELDRTYGLQLYDFHARTHDPQLARFLTPDPCAERYFPTSPYAYCAANPIAPTDPTGCYVQGATHQDAEFARDDMRSLFPKEQFGNFSDLITMNSDKKRETKLAPISPEAAAEALGGKKLNVDQQALVDFAMNTLNSKDQHKIAYIESEGNIPYDAQKEFVKETFYENFSMQQTLAMFGGIPTLFIAQKGGGGLTKKTKSGSYSLIFKDSNNLLHPISRAVTLGHELFGHARSLAIGRGDANQHKDAIQTENIIRRILEIHMHDGTGHGNEFNKDFFPDYFELPAYR